VPAGGNNLMKKITLILGGIRSGKSYFAEQRALFYSGKPVYIATAIAFDKEMEVRIARHRERRGSGFELVEEPYDLTKPLAQLKDRTVLVDCLTLNLSNRLLKKEEDLNLEQLIEADEAYLQAVHHIIVKNDLNVIFVSNEVGCAPVEVNKLGRYFQDLQGRWNRIMAGYADEVYMVQAGIPTLIKKNKIFPFKLGAPSYLLPTGYIENVTYLMNKVDDIQLLAFDTVKDDPLLKEKTLSTLDYLAKESNITYSVHMPVKPKLFLDFERRLEAAFYIIERLNRLKVSSYTFHYDLPDGVVWKDLAKDEIQSVEDLYIRFFKAIKKRFPGIGISLENTETTLSVLDRVVSGSGISFCIDIGHLLVQDWDLLEIETRLLKAPVVHLHGWEEKDGKRQDHRPIVYDRKIFKLLESFQGIVTIENYHKMLFDQSLKVLKEYF
jgi:adenosylcobinamide kinase/adenosylcobinamide-phosphate guanylyltransferase